MIISKILSVVTKKHEQQKIAMAVPAPTGKSSEDMKAQGLYVIQNMLTRMPNATQKEVMEALQRIIDSGASEFFGKMTPRTAIGLPNIYILDPDDVFEVDGKQYVSLSVEPSRLVGKSWTSPSGSVYAKGQMFEGEVSVLDLATGELAVLPLAPIKDKIIVPTGNREVVLQRANQEIKKYNEKIKSINDAIGASKLVLQIERAKEQIQSRLTTLEAIKSGTRKQLDRFRQAPLAAFESWASELREGVQSGRMSLRDAYDTILYLHMSSPEKLIADIESGNFRVPEELREGILAIARKEMEVGARKNEEEAKRELERGRRIQEKNVPEIHDVEIEPFALEDIPGGSGPGKEKYKEVHTTKSIWHQIYKLKASLEGSTKDAEELTKIKTSIGNMEKYMGDLQKGQRSKKFLNTLEGKPILDAMNNFLGESSLFIKRYATDIIQDGKVNPRLMGTEGTEGNALVAVALTRMYNVVKETISMYTGGETLPGAETVAQPEKELIKSPEGEVVQAFISKDKIVKISEFLWKAFEDRMRIR